MRDPILVDRSELVALSKKAGPLPASITYFEVGSSAAEAVCRAAGEKSPPTQTLITLPEQSEQTFCGHCGASSHYYEAAVDWTTFDTRGLSRPECRVWYRVEREHQVGCCREEISKIEKLDFVLAPVADSPNQIFVEAENMAGESVRLGEYVVRDDGLHAIRFSRVVDK